MWIMKRCDVCFALNVGFFVVIVWKIKFILDKFWVVIDLYYFRRVYIYLYYKQLSFTTDPMMEFFSLVSLINLFLKYISAIIIISSINGLQPSLMLFSFELNLSALGSPIKGSQSRFFCFHSFAKFVVNK